MEIIEVVIEHVCEGRGVVKDYGQARANCRQKRIIR